MGETFLRWENGGNSESSASVSSDGWNGVLRQGNFQTSRTLGEMCTKKWRLCGVFGLSIIKHVTLQKNVGHDYRYDPRKICLNHHSNLSGKYGAKKKTKFAHDVRNLHTYPLLLYRLWSFSIQSQVFRNHSQAALSPLIFPTRSGLFSALCRIPVHILRRTAVQS